MLGFMSGCALLSMWVQNTSAVTMVMPIVEAVLQQILRAKEGQCSGKDNPNLELDGSWKTQTTVLLIFFHNKSIVGNYLELKGQQPEFVFKYYRPVNMHLSKQFLKTSNRTYCLLATRVPFSHLH